MQHSLYTILLCQYSDEVLRLGDIMVKEKTKILFLNKMETSEDVYADTLMELYKENTLYTTQDEEAVNIFLNKPHNFHLFIFINNQEDISYLDTIKKVLSSNPALKVLLVNSFKDKQSIFKAIETGINKILLYPQSQDDLKINLQTTIEYIEQVIKLNELNIEALNPEKLVNEYKKAVDASTIFSISDLKGNILYANRQFLKVSGYSLEELKGKPHSIVRHPDMDSSAFKDLWETIQQKKVWQGIVKNKRKNGEAYYVDATVVPILDSRQNIVEYAGIRHDITELITKTQELSDLKDKQRAQDIQKALNIKIDDIIEVIPFPTIFVEEYSSKIISYNDHFRSIFSEHSCSYKEDCTLEELFVQEEPYLLSNTNLSFYDCYELSDENDRVVAININNTIYEFWVGVTQKENGSIISLVEKR